MTIIEFIAFVLQLGGILLLCLSPFVVMGYILVKFIEVLDDWSNK